MANKKVKRTLTITGVIVLLILTLGISLRFTAVQTLLVNQYFKRIEKKYEGRISVDHVLVRWPHRVELINLLVLDPLNDTLFYASSLRASVQKIDLDKNSIRLRRVILENPMARLLELPDGRMNYELLAEAFTSRDSLKEPSRISLSCNQFLIRNGELSIRGFGALENEKRVSWEHLNLKSIETQVDRFLLDSAGLQADIHALSCEEKSGFRIRSFEAVVRMDSAGLHTTGLELATGFSRISSPSATVKFPVHGSDSTDLNLEVILGMETAISPVDINLLGGIDNQMEEPIRLSGIFTGTLRNAHLQDARLDWPGLAYFEGDLDYEFPGTLAEAFFNLRTRSLVLNITHLANDVFAGQLPGFELDVPEPVKEIGRIEYYGMFTGTLENFITTGQWVLPYGQFVTNLTVQKNRPFKGYNFAGKISTDLFNPNEWIEDAPGISGMDFEIDIDGVWDGEKSINAIVNGDVRQFTFQAYTFRNLQIQGQAAGRVFDGTLRLRDPNLQFDLGGRFDLDKAIPEIGFDLQMLKADLNALNIIPNDTAASAQFNLHGDLRGKSLDDITGSISMNRGVYRNRQGTLNVDQLILSAGTDAGRRQINLYSDYLDARLIGLIHVENLKSQINGLISRFLPAFGKADKADPAHLNDFGFNVHLKNPEPVTRILFPSVQFKENTRISGSYDAGTQEVYIEGGSPQFALGGSLYSGMDLKVQTRGQSMTLKGSLARVQFDRNNLFEQVDLNVRMADNQIDLSLEWKNREGSENRGLVLCNGRVFKTPGGQTAARFGFPSTEIVYNDSLWKLNSFTLDLDPTRMAVSGMELKHRNESLGISGAISDSPSDTLFLSFNRLNLNHINQMNRSEDMTLSGLVTGNARFYDMKGKGMFLADLIVDSLGFNGQMLGRTTISSRSEGAGEPVTMSVLARRGEIKTLQVNGVYNPVNDSLNFEISLDKLRMDIANPFVNPDLRDVKGIASGLVKVTGKRNAPQLNGEVLVQKGSFVVDYLNIRFGFTHKIQITPGAFSLDRALLQDDEGNEAYLSGSVLHDNFKRIRLDMAVDYQNFILLNADETKNDGYWGRAYASGIGTIKGPLRNLVIDISATTSPKTKFFAPVNTADEAKELGFITYVEKPKEDVEPDLLDFNVERKRGYEVDLYGATVNIDLAVTPDAEVQLIFDSKVGDVLRAQGSGNIRIFVTPTTRWTLYGDYTIERGDYQFTLQNIPVKKLQIEPGGTIKWTKDIPSAQLEVDAVYRTKAALYDLLQDESNPEMTQRIPVEAHLLMSGILERPIINFNIVIPQTSNDLARSQLTNLTEEEVKNQVIYLLVLNRFMPLQGVASGTTRGYANAGLATTTEMLSNQLNYWLSQISNDFDIGFNYRPGDELTSDEVEVALSKQFLNNRMTLNVNGNYDVRQTNANANQLVGDVEVEYKINPSGKLRVKAFTRANDHLLYEYAPYTQGVGLFYREEFDSFSELLRRYKGKVSGKGR